MPIQSPTFKRAARTSAILFFLFMLLHQTDKLLIGPMQNQVMETFKMTYTQWGMINTGALLVGGLLYPLWGWLNDRYNRGKLLALASLIWGSTTWFSAIVKTFPTFLVSRSSTGIDDSSYPGMMSLLADYYPPKSRGKIYGLLQLTQPIGYLLGMVLALILGGMIGWRSIFYITGSLGIVLAIAIFFGVKDIPRGSSEEELKGVEVSKYKFSWKTAAEIFKKRSLIFVFAQGFIGVFPWNVITYYFFGYLATDRGYDSNTQLLIMAPAVLFMAAGYPLGGMLGDALFKRTKRGRLIAGATGILMGMIFLLHHHEHSQPAGDPLCHYPHDHRSVHAFCVSQHHLHHLRCYPAGSAFHCQCHPEFHRNHRVCLRPAYRRHYRRSIFSGYSHLIHQLNHMGFVLHFYPHCHLPHPQGY